MRASAMKAVTKTPTRRKREVVRPTVARHRDPLAVLGTLPHDVPDDCLRSIVAAGIVLEETSPAIIESIQKKLRTILGGLPPPSLGREAAQDPTEFVLECE